MNVRPNPMMARPPAGMMRPPPMQYTSPPPPEISPSEVDFEPQPVKVQEEKVVSTEKSNEKVNEVVDSINYLVKKLKSHPEYAVPPPPTIMKPTRTQQFTKAKEEGNSRFKDEKYDEAIKFFTVAVELAADRPPWESHVLAREELSLALSNRSLAHYNLHQYDRSLKDAEAVVEIKRPWSKGHFRKAKALIALDRPKEARDAIMLGLEFEPSNEDLKKTLEEADQKIISYHQQSQQLR